MTTQILFWKLTKIVNINEWCQGCKSIQVVLTFNSYYGRGLTMGEGLEHASSNDQRKGGRSDYLWLKQTENKEGMMYDN